MGNPTVLPDDPNLYLQLAERLPCRECGGFVELHLIHTCTACWSVLHPFSKVFCP